MKKKLLVLTAASIVSASMLGGCGPKLIGEEIDETKTQLHVKYTNGGFGSVWLDTLMDEFEEEFANYSFEEGKTGVQIIPDYDKRNVGAESIRGNSNVLYLQEDTDYYAYINAKTLKDITDVMNQGAVTGVDDSGNILRETTKTIADKVDTTYTQFYKYNNEKFYGLPLFETNVGLQYNVEVFEKYNLYFKKNASADSLTDAQLDDGNSVASLFITRPTDERSYGPDGRTGKEGNIDYSIDDGLPATYKDFHALLTRMLSKGGITPFIWNSTCTNYLTGIIDDAWATNEGPEQFGLNFTFDGIANNIVKLDGNTVTDQVEQRTITVNNRADLQLQKGKLEALKLAKLISKDSYYFADSWTTGYKEAQEYFINAETLGLNDFAFIVEGGWWFNEASDKFVPGQQETAKFSPFILPKADASRIGTPNVRVSDRRSLMFISNFAKGAELEVAKLFLSFLQNDHALETYTKYSSGMRGMIYDISEETYNSMSYFGKAAWDIARHTDTKMLPWLPLTDGAKEHVSEMDYAKYGFAIDENDGNPIKYFSEHKNVTPEEYFVKIYNFKK